MSKKLRLASVLLMLALISLACDLPALPFGLSGNTPPAPASTQPPASGQPAATQPGSGRTATAGPAGGALPVAVKVTELPAGMKVIEQGAVWDPAQQWVYMGFVIESTIYLTPLKVNYQIWRSGDTTQPSGKASNMSLGWLYSPRQYGGGQLNVIKNQAQPMLRLEFQFADQPLTNADQKNLAYLKADSLPTPFFTTNSAEFSAQKDSASGLFKVKAQAKVMNNLPVQTEVTGLFIFYDSAGKVVAFTPNTCTASTDTCAYDKSDKIEAKTVKEVTGELPYLLAAQPAKVKFYPMATTYIYVALSKVK